MRFTAVLFMLAIAAGSALIAIGVYRLVDGWQRGRAHYLLHALKPAAPGAFLLVGVQNILPDTLVAVILGPALTGTAVGLYLFARWQSRRRWYALSTRRGRAPEIERR